MFKLVFSFVLVALSSAYFFGADGSEQVANLRNCGVLICGLTLFVANLRTLVEKGMASTDSATPVVAASAAAPSKPTVTPAESPVAYEKQAVIGFLGTLQQKGRLLDFLMDDVTKYTDTQVAAAARVVHQGCASVLRDYFDIKPVTPSSEGTPLTLDKDFDASSYRLLGRVVGEPPFSGKLLHKGWLTTDVKLPQQVLSGDKSPDVGGHVIAPAEVELN